MVGLELEEGEGGGRGGGVGADGVGKVGCQPGFDRIGPVCHLGSDRRVARCHRNGSPPKGTAALGALWWAGALGEERSRSPKGTLPES